MSHAIRTNAAAILEKDIDPNSSYLAISRMIDIIKNLYPKAKISPLLYIYPQPSKSVPITINYSLISKLIGVKIPKEKIINIFKSLNFKFQVSNFKLTV